MAKQKSLKSPTKLKSKKSPSRVAKNKSNTRKSVLLRRLALSLMLFGTVLIMLAGVIYYNQTLQLSVFTPKAKSVIHSALARPVNILIPSINMELPITNTSISNGIWEIAGDGASYLATSAKPGQKGAIIMYGHNTPERFGPIRSLTPGKSVILKTTDNKIHLYKVIKTLEVFPSQMEVFDQKDETLVLYTCAGFADLKRFIVIAHPYN